MEAQTVYHQTLEDIMEISKVAHPTTMLLSILICMCVYFAAPSQSCVKSRRLHTLLVLTN